PLSAQHIVNQYSQEELTRIFRAYGELERPAAWSFKIVRAREDQAIQTTTELVDCLKPMLKRGRENKDLARVFQALRIEVKSWVVAVP
ncbi:MAG: 16S rRNA (cytosine(1402)-N(4))-methyltransferase, partial [Candidatus Zixiibacteriota bacterium]